MAFENGDEKASYTVIPVNVFGRLGEVQKYAFKNKDELAWSGKKILCFVFVETKTVTFNITTH